MNRSGQPSDPPVRMRLASAVMVDTVLTLDGPLAVAGASTVYSVSF